MRPLLLSLTLISASVCALAQQSSMAKPLADGCPVGFNARVNGRAIVYSVEDQKEYGNAPLLELSFHHSGSPIVGASITVHGWSGSDRFLPVFKSRDANAAQSFQLVAGNRANGLKESEVRPDKVLFVDWAELTELRFADGSVWHKSSNVRCEAEISKFRLVDATAEHGDRSR